MSIPNAMKLSVFGLGKLGCPMLAVFAESGYHVVGYDIDPASVEAVNNGKPPVDEPGLQELFERNRERFSATTDVQEAVFQTHASFIIVPTPSGDDAFFLNDFVVKAVAQIGKALKLKSEYHLVVVTSTVMPGSTEVVIKNTLEKASGREVGMNLGLCYSPEFIALGTVIHDMQYPDIILVGQSDEKAGDMLEKIMTKVVKSKPECHRMNFVCAELAKISVNTFVTTKISYANMIAAMCDGLPGADVNVVTSAIGCDTRIGRKCLKGATGYGGPCFPRDNKAFSSLGRKLGVGVQLAEATDAINTNQVQRIAALVQFHVDAGAKVAILGLSYKPDTSVSTESQSFVVATELLQKGFQIVLSDPCCSWCDELEQLKTKGVLFHRDFNEAVAEADAILIMTAWHQYKDLASTLTHLCRSEVTVIDPWRIVAETEKLKKVVIPGKQALIVG